MSTIACFRAEGVLLPRRASACAAWMALRQADAFGRFVRFGAALAAPAGRLFAAAEPAAVTHLRWRGLTGCSEDRLVVLGEDWWQELVREGLNPVGLGLVARCKAAGQRVVLVSDHPDVAVAPLRDLVGADEMICNRLEVVNGAATGRLLDPVVSGRLDGGWLREAARRHGLDPGGSAAYGATEEDATLLSGAARPCAVTPDRGLLRLALELDWPVVEA